METFLFALIAALIVAAIILAVMRGQMKPVARKHEAAQYTEKEDVKISVSDDVYLRTDVTRTPIETEQKK